MLRRILVIAGVLLIGAFAGAEAVHARAAGRRLGDRDVRPGGVEAVVVLGYRNRGRRANLVNRYRVRAGLRSFDERAAERVLVLCGGAVAGETAEARIMADVARELGYAGVIRLDQESTTTWENIRNAIPLIEDADSIAIVSNSLHAEKARAYLWQQRPDLARRLRRGGDYRFGEIPVMKVGAALIALTRRG